MGNEEEMKKGNFVFTSGGKKHKRESTIEKELPKHRIKEELPVLKHEQFPGQGGRHGYKKGSGLDDNHAFVEVLDDTESLKHIKKKKWHRELEPEKPIEPEEEEKMPLNKEGIAGIVYPRGTFSTYKRRSNFRGPPKKVEGEELPKSLYDEPPKIEYVAREISDVMATKKAYEDLIEEKDEKIDELREQEKKIEVEGILAYSEKIEKFKEKEKEIVETLEDLESGGSGGIWGTPSSVEANEELKELKKEELAKEREELEENINALEEAKNDEKLKAMQLAHLENAEHDLMEDQRDLKTVNASLDKKEMKLEAKLADTLEKEGLEKTKAKEKAIKIFGEIEKQYEG